MATFYQTEQSDAFQPSQVSGRVDGKAKIALDRIRKILGSYALFHVSFVSLLSFLLISSITLASISPSSLLFALFLATIFLTLFSYITMAFYFESRKKEQFKDVIRNYLLECKKLLPLELEDETLHRATAESCLQLVNLLRKNEIFGLTMGPFHFLEKTLLRSRYLLHHKDVLYIQEKLIKRAIDEYVQTIEDTPTSLEVHTSLADLFMTLAKLYSFPDDKRFSDSFLINLYFDRSGFEEKRYAASKKAIQELNILDELAPSDPWVHAMLAACHNALDDKEQEIASYEILRTLRPEDKEILFRLGTLYFARGDNAKGLKLFKELKSIDMVWAKNLLSHYTM